MARNTVEPGRTSGRFAAVTPHDSNNLSSPTVALYIGTTGNLVVHDLEGTSTTFENVPVGYHPLRVKRVLSTGTTASNIVALY